MIKSYYLKIVVVAITLFTLSGCAKFLEEEIKNNASPSNFYSNLSECKAAVNGTYVVLYDMFSSTDFFVTAEASTDLMVMKTANNINGTFGYSPSAPGTGQELWKNAYKGIMYANNTIAGIESAPITALERKALIAEVVALRSLYYYFLTSVFSDVPYWDKGLLTEDNVNEVISLPRMNADEIRVKLIADLELYAPALLAKASGNDIGRVTQGFAYGLMAKIALFNKDWAKAKWATEQVINSGVYDLAPSYGDIYTDVNNKENIFEVQYSYSPTGLQRSHSIYNWCMPSPRSGSTSVYDGVDMESSSATTYGSVQPTRRLASYYTTTDKRRAHVLAYDYKGKQFNRAKNQNLPWMGPKMWDFTSINIASGKNLLYMRYADILLMMAEASIELEELDDAKFYMDLVRNRAGIGSIAVTNQTIMTDELRKERGRELSGEYVRKWDLVRWGIFYESIKSVALDYPTAAQNVRPYHLYYPIPALERVKNPALSQNNGY